jgi:hypothetical protein
VTRPGENAADGATGFLLAGRRESCLVSAVSECRAVRRDGGFVRGLPDVGIAGNAVALQCLHAILGAGRDIAAAVAGPLFHGPDFMTGDSVNTPAASASAVARRLSGTGTSPRLASAARRAREAGIPAGQRWAAMLAGIPRSWKTASIPLCSPRCRPGGSRFARALRPTR